MGKVMRTVRTKLGLAAVGGALLLTGVGFGAAAVAPSVGTRQVSDVATVTSDPTPTVTEPAPTSAAPVAPAPVVAQPTAVAPATTSTAAPSSVAVVAPSTVATVTTSPAAPVQPKDTGVGTVDSKGNYLPAPPKQNPGEPPYAGPAPVQPVPCLPGEMSARCGGVAPAPQPASGGSASPAPAGAAG